MGWAVQDGRPECKATRLCLAEWQVSDPHASRQRPALEPDPAVDQCNTCPCNSACRPSKQIKTDIQKNNFYLQAAVLYSLLPENKRYSLAYYERHVMTYVL